MATPAPTGTRGVGATLYAHVDRTFAVVDYEVRKLRHDPSELLLRAVQPALWLVVFGEVFATVHAIPTGNLSYLEFLAPGILSQSVLFIAIFYGIASIRERELGIAYKFLVSPASRISLVAGKALSASVRGLSQAVIVYLLAIALAVHPSLAPLSVLGVLVAVVLGSCLFATLSMIIASLVKTQERFLGIGQLLTMPLFFASNAIYPISIMPSWLQPVAYANPLTYLVDAVRTLMIPGETGLFPLGIDFGVLAAVTVALVLIESRLYPRMAQ
ncbi:MAG TPA: ABC transporter permease [Thermoplasmata archaeon]|jgi:ABC-2 type transport system permease protein|nr:ABC transporter permease [Thermoplasmata archaeon]